MHQLVKNTRKTYIKQEGHEGPGLLTWENLIQLKNMAIYISKVWPSELHVPFNPIPPTIDFVKTLIKSGVALETIFSFQLAL